MWVHPKEVSLSGPSLWVTERANPQFILQVSKCLSIPYDRFKKSCSLDSDEKAGVRKVSASQLSSSAPWTPCKRSNLRPSEFSTRLTVLR